MMALDGTAQLCYLDDGLGAKLGRISATAARVIGPIYTRDG